MARVKSSSSSPMAILAIAVMFMSLVSQSYAQLSVGFYKNKCGAYDVESEIYKVVSGFYATDKTIVAALLRMLFHDAYGGCDASLLLDGPEKSQDNNLSVRGYNIIDACKSALEKVCPKLVSCTDILVIATRYSVYLAGGTYYNVETGRRDATTSSATTGANLPGPTIPVSEFVNKMAARGLSAADTVLLLAGGHTVGIIHCKFFLARLYNFKSTGLPDPSINTTTLSFLKKTCPSGGSNNFVYADQTPGSGLRFDSGFFKAIKMGQGILEIDQRLASDPSTRAIVNYFATSSDFATLFAGAVNKLTRYGALTGTQGQIRTNCHRVNSY
ncbi:peroxidase 57-like [Silene latifolia]|uniref:peroxidase 57-like n=1 Tax=Silene latifolia TaxID=37657 RepID=UPI003D778924